MVLPSSPIHSPASFVWCGSGAVIFACHFGVCYLAQGLIEVFDGGFGVGIALSFGVCSWALIGRGGGSILRRSGRSLLAAPVVLAAELGTLLFGLVAGA